MKKLIFSIVIMIIFILILLTACQIAGRGSTEENEDEKSNNATLKSVQLGSEPFPVTGSSPAITTPAESAFIIPIPSNNKATMRWSLDQANWTALVNGEAINVYIGEVLNVVNVYLEITAEDGKTIENYTLRIGRSGDPNPYPYPYSSGAYNTKVLSAYFSIEDF